MPLDKNIKYTASKRKRPLIVVTNDDGVASPGIKALSAALKKVGDVLVVAPVSEQSTTSHSLTLHRPLRCKAIRRNVYAVDGTPTDCVNLAVNFILRGTKPDMIFSGINRGPNLGDDINYSGTVSAAIEGGIVGVPSIAISVAGSLADAAQTLGGFTFKAAAEFAVRAARQVLKRGLPKDVILNINVPNLPTNKIKGYKMTFQGKKNYANLTTEKLDPRGVKYYWICGEEAGFDDIPGSDCNAINNGCISITPLRVSLTESVFLKKMNSWRF